MGRRAERNPERQYQLQGGRIGLGTPEYLPPRPAARGRFTSRIPARCPDCGGLLAIDGRWVHCQYGCGRDWYLVAPDVP